MTTQCRISLTMLVKIRRMSPAAMVSVHEQHHAFTNIYEETYCAAASGETVSIFNNGRKHNWRKKEIRTFACAGSSRLFGL